MLKRTIIVSLGVMLALVLSACAGGDDAPQPDRNTTGGSYSASVDTTVSLTEAQLGNIAESVDDDLLANGRVSLGQSELVVAGDYRCRSGDMEPGTCWPTGASAWDNRNSWSPVIIAVAAATWSPGPSA